MSAFNIAQITAIALMFITSCTAMAVGQPKLAAGILIGFLVVWVPITVSLFVGGGR